MSRSSDVERERLEPQERNERVCRGQPDTAAFSNRKREMNFELKQEYERKSFTNGFRLIRIALSESVS
jgi:hypothetical protein